MLDGRWRTTVEAGLAPLGRSLHRLGLSADGLTVVGMLLAIGTGVLAIMLPAPNAANDRARRWRGPIAPSRANAFQPA